MEGLFAPLPRAPDMTGEVPGLQAATFVVTHLAAHGRHHQVVDPSLLIELVAGLLSKLMEARSMASPEEGILRLGLHRVAVLLSKLMEARSKWRASPFRLA